MRGTRNPKGDAGKRLVRLLSLLPLFALGSCSGQDAPMATAPEVAPTLAYSVMPTAASSTVPGVAFLPPLGGNLEDAGAFDGSLLNYMTFEVCELDTSGDCGAVVATLTSQSPAASSGKNGQGGRGSSGTIHVSSESYDANWAVGGLSAGTAVRIRVLVAGTDLGHVDGGIVAAMKDAKAVESKGLVPIQAGRTVPIRVRIDKGVVFVVGSQGGSFATLDGGVQVSVPAGALTAPVGFTVRPAADPLPEPTLVPGTAFDVGPADVSFATPASVVLRYGDARPQPDTVPAGRFRLHRLDLEASPPAWVQDYQSTSDLSAATVTGRLGQTGTIAVLRRRVPARVEVTPADTSLPSFGDTATLRAVAYAKGGWAITDADFAWKLADGAAAKLIGAPARHGTYGATATAEALANGTAGVAVSTEGVDGSTKVTVRQVPASVELGLGSALLEAFDDTTTVSTVVKDAKGHLIADDALIDLSWTSGDAGVATVAKTSPRTGRATATGNGVVTLTATDAQGAKGTVELTVKQKPFGVAVISGDGQVAALGEVLAEPFVAEVQDANGYAIAHVGVTWGVLSGGGSLGQQTTPTDATGRTSAVLTLGSQVEVNEAQVFVTDHPDVAAVFDGVPSSPPVPTSGGQISAFNGAVTLNLPPNAIPSSTPISVRPVDPDELGLEPGDVVPGTLYQFGPHGLQFSADDSLVEPAEVPEADLPPEYHPDTQDPPVVQDPDASLPPDTSEVQYPSDELDQPVEEAPTEALDLHKPVELTLKYDQLPEGTSSADEDALVVAWWNPDTGAWEEVEGSRVDPATHTVSAPIAHFSYYAVRMRARAPRIYGRTSGPIRRWAHFRANTQVTWRIYRRTRWRGLVRVDRYRRYVAIDPFGPGPWVVQATAKRCGYTRTITNSWVDYARWLWAVRRHRIRYQWSYVRDARGRIRTRIWRYRRYVEIRRYSRRWTCASASTNLVYRALSPVPHAVVLRPAGSLTLGRLGWYYPLYVRVYDALGRYLPWAHVAFTQSNASMLRVFNVRDVSAWDRWLAQPRSYGTSVLKAKAYGGVESNAVTLTVDLIPASITVTPTDVTLSGPGATSQLQATVLNQFGTPVLNAVTWTSSSTAVTVDGTGRVTGVSPGQAVVRATTKNGLSASATVTVKAPPPPTWSISGPGTISVSQETDAKGTADVGSYSLKPAGLNTVRQWQFSATASSSGTVTLPWSYSGFHAYFNVKVFLNAYVRHSDGSETVVPLVNDSAAQCCTAPSSGFNYSGTTTLSLQAGDTYGFRFGGSNYDSNNVLQGTLKVYRQP